jgi:hypothetical protein
MFLANRGTPRYYPPFNQIKAVAQYNLISTTKALAGRTGGSLPFDGCQTQVLLFIQVCFSQISQSTTSHLVRTNPKGSADMQ